MIVAGFAFQMLFAHPDGSAAVKGLVIPKFAGSESVLLAAGILGATVMPHVIYLHSSLTQRRVVGADARERRRIFRFEQIDVVIAMTIAGLVNMPCLSWRPASSTRAVSPRSTTSTWPTTRSAASSGTTPTSSSAARCSRRVCRRPSVGTPGRS